MPELGAAAVAAKLDTGARGTALHATEITVEGDRVRFTLHPLPETPAGVLRCEAALADRRGVTSSNGVSEARPFIRTALSLAGLPAREVEISLTARPLMRFRLLVGREALAGWNVLIDPGATSAGVLR
ncbi:MAG: RimK/LysX family protein [Proteobacteria bacterium]|nr:RimK/LysX family protein [Pseudomonadota bacterium]